MLSREQLQQTARDDCLSHAKQVVAGELKVELGESEQRWSPTHLRYVFDQAMVIWRQIAPFEVLLDADDRPVGFVDPDKWQDCQWRQLGQWDVQDLAVCDRDGVVDLRRFERPVANHVEKERPDAWTKYLGERAALALPGFLRRPEQLVIALVQIDGNTALVQTTCYAGVVRMAVRQDQRRNVIERAADRGQCRFELVPVTRQRSVHNRDAPSLFHRERHPLCTL